MKQCVIWGTGNEYENIINQVKWEEQKGNLKCNAVLSKTRSQFAKKLDGYDIIDKEGLRDVEFDYLIVAAGASYAEIQAEATAMGVPESRIIPGRVFKLINFDFKKYLSLLENPVTILSNDCWGGLVYNLLGLQFSSPLINTLWAEDSYFEFIQDPFFYLEQPLRMEREGIPRKNVFPLGRLGEGTRSVEVQFLHEPSFEVAAKKWNERKKRIHRERIFVKAAIGGDNPRREEYLSIFEQIPYDKLCLYSGETDIKDVVYAKKFEWDWYHKSLNTAAPWYNFGNWVLNNIETLMDPIKLLNGEKDYMREQ